MQCWLGCLQAKSLEGKLVETEKRLRDVVQASQMQAAKARLEVSSTTPHLHAAGCNRQMHALMGSASNCSESLRAAYMCRVLQGYLQSHQTSAMRCTPGGAALNVGRVRHLCR